MTKAARKLMDDENNYDYGLIGADICMGDHKVSILPHFICSFNIKALTLFFFLYYRFHFFFAANKKAGLFEIAYKGKSRYSQ